MAKQFKIYFSESDDIVNETIDPDMGEQPYTIREFEIELLKVIFKIASRFQKAIPDSIMCKDVVDQLEKTEIGSYIELTKKDLEFAKIGWANSAGMRTYSMTNKGESILSQLHNPFDPDSEKEIKFDQKTKKFFEVDPEKEDPKNED